jgi:hypothetical protein
MTAVHMEITRSAEATATQIDARFVRCGLGLFVFGLVIGYGPWLHCMHGSTSLRFFGLGTSGVAHSAAYFRSISLISLPNREHSV